MRHYSITLERQDRSVRQWSVWADTLTVGSHPRSALVLPEPVAPHEAVLEHDGVLELPIGRLLVHDDTPIREHLWAKARERMALARKLEWREPGANNHKRALAMAALSLFGLFGLVAMGFIGGNPPKVPDEAIPEEIMTILLQQEQPPEPPKPQEQDLAPKETDQPKTVPDPAPNGGPTEPTTIARTETSPAAVMKNSVMGMLDDMNPSAIGEDIVDPNAENLVDVMVAGKMGQMKKGIGGQGPIGDGDRMKAVAGYGFGYQGTQGFGPGADGGRKGPRLGGSPKGGLIAKPRPIPPPTMNDVVLGGEAGTRSPESILRVIRSSIMGFQYTYQKYLREHPELGGKISLQFTIAPNGSIVAIQVVGSNTGNPKLDEDIREKARRMAFDPIEKGNVTVTYAFVLDRQ